MIHEFAVLIDCAGRYPAHVEMDRLFPNQPRHDAHGLARWRYALISIGTKFIGLLRTDDPGMIQILKDMGAPWSEIRIPGLGEKVDMLVHLAPKKKGHLTRFRTDDEFALWHCSDRFLDSIEVDTATIEARSTEVISKNNFAHSVPTALIRLEGVVINPVALRQSFLFGVGGSRAFGLGLPMLDGSRAASYVMKALGAD